MSKIYVYVHTDGLDFDVKQFQSSLPSNLRGEIKVTKRIENGKTVPGRKHWKSPEIIVSEGDPEHRLMDLLSGLRAALITLRRNGSLVRYFAELVAEYERPEDVRGFYFSPQFVKLLAEVDGALDIDIYCRSPERDRPSK